MKAGDFLAARNMVTMARERVQSALALGEKTFMTVTPGLVLDSATSIACASLRVRGTAIESNLDPHQELCERLEEEFPGETHRLIVEIGKVEIPSLEHVELVHRAIDYMEAMLPCLAGVIAETDGTHFRKLLSQVSARLPRFVPDDGPLAEEGYQRTADLLGVSRKVAKELHSLYGPRRDPARIDGILARVATVWQRCPDLRLGQLLLGVTGDLAPVLFNVEDDEIASALEVRFGQSGGEKPHE